MEYKAIMAILSVILFFGILFKKDPPPQVNQFTGGMWVTRDKDGRVLSMAPDRPIFDDMFNKVPIKGIVTYGYEWPLKTAPKIKDPSEEKV